MQKIFSSFIGFFYNIYLGWIARQLQKNLLQLEQYKQSTGQWNPDLELCVEILDMIPDVLIQSIGKNETAKHMLGPGFISAYNMIEWLRTVNHFVYVKSVNKVDRYLPDHIKTVPRTSVRFSVFLKDLGNHTAYDVYDFYRDLHHELVTLVNGLKQLESDGDQQFAVYYRRALKPFYLTVFEVVETLAEMSLEHA